MYTMHGVCVCVCAGKKEGESSQKKDQGEEAVVEVEQLEIEEPGEPPRPPVLSRALAWLRDEVWPKTRWLFIFTIERDGRVGIFLRVFGTLMAFLSCFTITYQVLSLCTSTPQHTDIHLHVLYILHTFSIYIYNYYTALTCIYIYTCRLHFRTTLHYSGLRTMSLSSTS